MTETLQVTFTYSHETGTFEGILPSGHRFQFIANMESPLPIKLRLELGALAHRQVQLAQQIYRAREKELNSPMLTAEEYSQKLEAYLEAGGLVQKAGRIPKPKVTLESLGLDSFMLGRDA